MTAIVILIASSLQAQVLYDLTDLGEGAAYGINNSGQVVGDSNDRPVIFDSTGGGSNTYLADEGVAWSINNNGQIVGQIGILVGQQYAVLFDPDSDVNNVILGNGCAYSINNAGEIVGYERSDGIIIAGSERATLFSAAADGNNTDLGNGKAYSINDNGQAVGVTWESFLLPIRATLFDTTGEEANIDLGAPGSGYSYARSINNSAQIVGYYNGPHWIGHPPPPYADDEFAMLFDSTGDGNNINLGRLHDDDYASMAYSINNNDQIVGCAYTSSGEKHAVMFDSTGDGNNLDLNDLIDPAPGWTLSEARCISDNGWIAGQMTNSEGDEHAFLLTPTPLKIAIDNIDEAIAQKLYALETIDIALEEESAALEALNEMLVGGDFGGLIRRDIRRAKLRIYGSIYRQMRSKAELRSSIEGLERSLELLNAN